MSRGSTKPSIFNPLRAPMTGSDGSLKYAITAKTSARPASTRVEGSRRIARDYCTSACGGLPPSPCGLPRSPCAELCGRGQIRALEILENARPLDGLCKHNVRTRLARAREERLTVAGHHEHADSTSGPRPKLANQHVARDVRQPKVAQHDIEALLRDQVGRLPAVRCGLHVRTLG